MFTGRHVPEPSDALWCTLPERGVILLLCDVTLEHACPGEPHTGHVVGRTTGRSGAAHDMLPRAGFYQYAYLGRTGRSRDRPIVRAVEQEPVCLQ